MGNVDFSKSIKRGWIAKLKNGKIVKEGEMTWSDIESEVCGLTLVVDGRSYSLPLNMSKYFQAKTMSASMSGGNVSIHSRYIGFTSKNNESYIIRVDENTLECKIEIIP